MDTWKSLGACHGQKNDPWFPEKNSNYRDKRLAEALAICERCTVRAQCLDYALVHDEIGVWGATTEAERRVIKNRYVRPMSPKHLAYRPLLG